MTRWDVLIDLINTSNYRSIAEIGVHRGKTTRKVLEACDLKRYVLVDPEWYLRVSLLVSQHPECHYLVRTSESATAYVEDNALDLVFLDALHDYENVLKDIDLWQPKIRSGGVLCGDDYGQAHCEGVKQAVDEVFGDKVELREIGSKGVKVWMIGV